MSFLAMKVFGVCAYAIIAAWIAVDIAANSALAMLLIFSIALVALFAVRQPS